jgi:hypothetical protein
MTTIGASNNDSDSDRVEPAPVDASDGAGLVIIGFDERSVSRSGVILAGMVAALMLALWLFSVTRHFLF